MEKRKLINFLFTILVSLSMFTSCGNNIFEHKHKWNEGIIIDEPTCEEEGLILFACKRCKEKKEEVIPSKGHVKIIDEKKLPTCTEKGLTEGSHCEVCNKVFIEQESVPSLGGHKYNESYKCIQCEEYYCTKGVCFESNGDEYYVSGYIGRDKEVVIPPYYLDKPVIGIKEYAFDNNYIMEKVFIPEGVKTIKKYAFRDCGSLKEIVLPDSITTIEEYAFTSTKITSFDFPSSLQTISEGMLEHCNELKNMIIPENIKNIEEFAFRGCLWLTSIVIPESVDTIERFAFYECFHLNIFCYANKNQGRIWNEGWDIYESEGALSGRVEYEYLPVYWKGEWQYNSNGIPEPLI